MDEIGLDGRHRLDIFQWTFVLGFWIGQNRTNGEFFNGVLGFCLKRMEFFGGGFCRIVSWFAIVGVLAMGLGFACHGFGFCSPWV